MPTGKHSGYRIRIEQEIIHLLEAGIDVHFACLHPSSESNNLKKHKDELLWLGCPVYLVEVINIFELSLSDQKVSKTLDILEAIINDQNIEIVHAEALYCGKLAYFLRERNSSIKFIFDCHGISPEEELMSGANERRIKVTEKWENFLLEKSDLNIFVSEAMHQHFNEKYGQTNVPHRIVPCCVQGNSFAAIKRIIPTFAPEGSKVIGYLGSRGPSYIGGGSCKDGNHAGRFPSI